nr:hypothetical protein GCM10020093_061080 [Planobispora longispora]
MYRHVWAKDFWTKEVYLGVRLGQRGVQLGTGVFAQLFGFYQRSEKALGIEDDQIPKTEIARWTDSAERLGRALGASALYARHATSTELAWLFQHAATGSSATRPPRRARSGGGARGRSSPWSRGRSTTAGRCSGSSSRTATPTSPTCRSPASPT